MNVSFRGIHETIATFKAGTGVDAGVPVKVSAEGTVAACSANDEFAGVVTSVREGYCAVQLSGYAEMSYSGTAPSYGKALLVADGSGKVKTAASGRAVTVVHLNTTTGVCGFLM